MELILDLCVRRNVNEKTGDKGFLDIMHETIDETDLLEFMQEKMDDYESNIIVDSIIITNVKP